MISFVIPGEYVSLCWRELIDKTPNQSPQFSHVFPPIAEKPPQSLRLSRSSFILPAMAHPQQGTTAANRPLPRSHVPDSGTGMALVITTIGAILIIAGRASHRTKAYIPPKSTLLVWQRPRRAGRSNEACCQGRRNRTLVAGSPCAACASFHAIRWEVNYCRCWVRLRTPSFPGTGLPVHSTSL